MADLSVELAGLELANPVLLASGILDSTSGILERMADSGAGALITKSISLEPRPGYAGPTVAEVAPGTWMNAMGLPNPGLAEFLEEFDLKDGKVPVIPNLVADTPAEFGKLAVGVAEAGAKLAEINLSCPHPQAAYTGLLTAQDPEAAAATVAAASEHLPVIAKLSPNVSDIGTIAVACAEAGAAAVSAINTMPALDIDTELERPVLGNAFGGLSGPALLPIGLRCVLKAVRALRDAGHATPVIGIGGISNGEDAAKYLLCGAQAVQVGTALGGNPERLGEIATELGDWMERKDYATLDAFRGNALEWLP
ncbi:MAG: dihydroorotate dehydrogenase [Candidatus Thermoplasmatota archaeon]|nr:dihydroorotate dehydrogenase [Candidatus Thermoplasmatota archaeon]